MNSHVDGRASLCYSWRVSLPFLPTWAFVEHPVQFASSLIPLCEVHLQPDKNNIHRNHEEARPSVAVISVFLSHTSLFLSLSLSPSFFLFSLWQQLTNRAHFHESSLKELWTSQGNELIWCFIVWKIINLRNKSWAKIGWYSVPALLKCIGY